MNKLIASILFAICAVFSSYSVSAQQIPAEMMPEVVRSIQTMLPQKIDDGMTFSKVYLENSNSGMVCEFLLNEKAYGISSNEFINELKNMSKREMQAYLGEELVEISQMISVPLYMVFKFTDGKSYKLKVSD